MSEDVPPQGERGEPLFDLIGLEFSVDFADKISPARTPTTGVPFD